MQQLAQKLKLLRFGDLAVRRNPLYYAAAREQPGDAASVPRSRSGARGPRASSPRSLWAAQRTAYGQRVRGTRELASWPLLEKTAVRADPIAFGGGGSVRLARQHRRHLGRAAAAGPLARARWCSSRPASTA